MPGGNSGRKIDRNTKRWKISGYPGEKWTVREKSGYSGRKLVTIQFNLLDLNNDVLNIIGDYVKADNDERDFQKYLRGEVINNSIKLFEIIKYFKWKFAKKNFERFNY